ncbi:response regulator transcription factor [Proteiniclasticum ruminis]|uniref:Stage 0 sporulation protein A homolog n=1 Tax=Proteiniclasticum ruminis TaxID=398199 RepID=A0A1I4ZUI8_9CLOT|nr:response regulator transcription factor [Proteiniclasticum ruminis]SFN53904.1 DNA-binding response regulator, OmpR family, contains REC and winged-helix (wHTH) domain [Proteiniclasticum ruminis]
MNTILLVEDDKAIVENLVEILKREGYRVENAKGQQEALNLLPLHSFDLCLLDISLSEGNGFALCRAIKDKEPDLPVIFLTASGDEYSVVAGFDMGADDYVKKPFRPMELLSRIKNVLRRSGKAQSVVEIRHLSVDTVKGVVKKSGEDVFLSALEYRLLLVFLSHKGMILSRTKLLEEIWDAAGDFVSDNTLTVYIKRLREKIEEDPQNPEIIKTVRGLGYKVGEE